MNQNFQNKFIKVNKKFWKKFKESDGEELLLVETSGHPVINHANAIAAKIIAKAKNLRIAWIRYQHTNEALMQSYSENSVFIDFPIIPFYIKLYFLFLSFIYYFYYVIASDRLLAFKYKQISYGDFVYDGYLNQYKMATLHKFDPRTIMIFYRILVNDLKARSVLKSNSIKAVLVAHRIGLGPGPLSRVAMQMKIPLYWKGGGHEIIELAVFKKLEQIYDYPLKPTNKLVDLLLKDHKKKVEADFDEFISHVDNPYYGAFSVGYGNVVFSKITRKSFLKKMKLKNKPIIFVMLHAFNDHPHSHFKKMIFKDYYHWFIETLNFAKKDKSKNWIFKEHPANKFYPTKDLDFKKIMTNIPNHLRFVSHKSWVKASTVLNVADTVITCLGSSGLEMPALRGIPSVIGGDTFFDQLGFTIEPKSRAEYFKILKKLPLKKLTKEKQLRAKAAYLYSKKYSTLPFAAGPALTLEESRDLVKLKKIYPQRILGSYKKKKQLIYKQFNKYSKKVKKADFKILLRPPF